MEQIFGMFDICYSPASCSTPSESRMPSYANLVGFRRLSSAYVDLPVFESAPLPSSVIPHVLPVSGPDLFSALLAGVPQPGPVSDICEYNLGCALSLRLRSLSTAGCSDAVIMLKNDLQAALVAIPPSYRARFLRIAHNKHAFILPDPASSVHEMSRRPHPLPELTAMPVVAQRVLARLYDTKSTSSRPHHLLPAFHSDDMLAAHADAYLSKYYPLRSAPFEAIHL